jgi:hypothetical protein
MFQRNANWTAAHMRDIALTVFGLIVAVTPLALWVAWSESVFILVLAGSIGALALICVLVRGTRQPGDDERQTARPGHTQHLSDESLAELSELGPFIYHHRRTGGPRFQSSMRTLKRKLRIS